MEKSMRWFLFEDKLAEQLNPIALTRPVFELVCGREGLRRRLQRWFTHSEWGVQIRPWLKDVYAEEHPECSVNQLHAISADETLMVNGRWLPGSMLQADDVTFDNAGFVDGHLAWIALSADEMQLLRGDDFEGTLLRIAHSRRVVEASGRMFSRPWDLLRENAGQLETDFRDAGVSMPPQSTHVQVLGNETDAYISPEAVIDPYVVIDVRNGPVSIANDVHVQSFTRIEGPCHIASGSRIFRGLISGGTTIGPHCRVGGEVEESILHSHVNKYHEGFLGHSYVCPWVNIGAISTTSDLKSDYSTVKVPLDGDPIESDMIKVGSFIGDHTKTAIDSMFNTGSSIGVMTLVLPGGRLLPRHIPSFCNVSFGKLASDWPLEKSLSTARVAMQRRGCEFTEAAEKLFRYLHETTRDQRESAVAIATSRQIQGASGNR